MVRGCPSKAQRVIPGDTGPAGADGAQGPAGQDGAAGAPGRSIAAFTDATEPAGALAGDIWFEP